MSSSPTSRSLNFLRSLGWAPAVVEKWVPRARRRVDLFGCLDLVVLRPGVAGVLGLQVTSGPGNGRKRQAKIEAEDRARLWLECGNQVHVHCWIKRKAGWCLRVSEAELVEGQFVWTDTEDRTPSELRAVKSGSSLPSSG